MSLFKKSPSGGDCRLTARTALDLCARTVLAVLWMASPMASSLRSVSNGGDSAGGATPVIDNRAETVDVTSA
ncbi:MAG: hypothetical protein R2856_40095 [Caldilineaceae bacterium]